MKHSLTILFASLLLCCITPGIALCFSHGVTKGNRAVFGPEKFERSHGKPDTETVAFSIPEGGSGFSLHVQNGDHKGRHRVTSGTITLNGSEVLVPSDFHHHAGSIKRPVALPRHNVLTVRLQGKPGSFLVIAIYGGSDNIAVPNVAGMAREAAEATITSAGLAVGTISSQLSDTVPAGHVMSQSPSPGISVPLGAAVTLTVSLGQTTTIVPNVAGLTQSAAEAAILAANLSIGAVTNNYGSTAASGKVVGQNPAAGLSVTQGTAVSLVVSLREAPPVVPPDPSEIAPPVDGTITTTVAASTEFLYTGANPIQTGVAPGTIEVRRAAVLRGQVNGSDGNPIPGVTITVLNHPEFGQTLTRADGMFDMAVNGGGVLTVNYRKDGYMRVQRQVNATWNDFAWLSDVVMLPFDNQVTTVNLALSTPIQVVRGSVSTDADGTRQATMFFSQGTAASMVMPDGTTKPLTRLNVRATEYTVGPNGPKAMPAVLPPSSAYTYAVELSADEAIAAGASEVRFNKPVYFYVENFLNFPVGGIVPAGYYDYGKAAWIPSDNGKIVRVLALNGGMAELDTDGSGQAADASRLAALGITDAERRQLAALYAPGQSLWRAPVTHFTPWDCNWPYGLPEDAVPPDQPVPEGMTTCEKPDCKGGSIIECQNQTLGESIPITGTPFTLNYRSDRVPGRTIRQIVRIPLSGSTVPASLTGIILKIRVAGRPFEYHYPASPNLAHEFTWDGVGPYGRKVYGAQNASISIGYRYGAIKYASPAAFERSFALAGGALMEVHRTLAPEIILWQYSSTRLYYQDAVNLGLGAWSLNVHHVYDPNAGILYAGNGLSRQTPWMDSRALAHTGIISTVAGNGNATGGGDNGPAALASVSGPGSVAFGADGGLYIQESYRTRKVSNNGIITTVAGNGNQNASDVPAGDGGPATSAPLAGGSGISLATDNTIYFSEYQSNSIRRVGTDGIITSPATGLKGPKGVVAAPDGSVYFVEQDGNRVCKITQDGRISTVAGLGEPGTPPVDGNLGDAGPATAASLRNPKDIALGNDGSLYIADSGNNRIRIVTSYGRIYTVAGNDSAGFNGEYVYNRDAQLNNPSGIATGPDGGLFIADTNNQRIRYIRPYDTMMATIAGNGEQGFNGDSIPATTAALNEPADIAVAPDGSLYIADKGNNRVRRVSSPANASEYFIAEEGGNEAYLFDRSGRHTYTIHTLTGAILNRFGYDANGRLITVTDGDGNITSIERDAAGNPVAIVAPRGRKTTVTVDGGGYINSVTNPAGETFGMTYSTGGLMTSFTDPKGNSSSFSYDSDGLLTSDRNAAGGFSTLSGIRMSDSSIVTLTTALGRTTSYYTENLKNGDQRRTTTLPTGAQSARFIASGGNEQSTSAEGMFTTTVKSLDPRFYTQAPLTDTTVSTPSGLTAALTARRSVTLSDGRNPFKLARQIDTLSLNGSNYTSRFEAISKQLTFTTPMGRKSISLLDGMGRILSFTPDPAVTPVAVNYNQEGKPAQTIQGNQSYSFGYDLPGRLASLTDALGNKTQYSYDNADRVTRLTLPSGREYNFTYDLNSNLTGITMPNGAAHNLGYTVVNLGSDYTPPDNPPYNFSHNLDKEWSGTLLPSGRRIDAGYDEGGRLSVRTYHEAGVDYLYEGATYRVKKITRSPAAGGSAQELSFSYDGSLVTERSFSGVANGQFTYVYDNNFLPVQIKFVSGTDSVTTSLTRDEDGLVTVSGPFSLTRSGPAGAVSRIYETYSAQLENVVVPNVAGMPRAEAEAALFGANLVLNRVYQEYSDTIPEGSVISQDPAAGATVSPGSPVNLTVCTYILGRARQTGRLPLLAMAGEAIPVLANSVTIVPDVTGMDRQFAEAAILAANLALGGDTTEYSDTIPAGNVISQDPVAGSPATEGSPVYLVVSSGPGRYVPDVVGMTQAEASQYILQENLVPGAIKAIVSNTVPIGNVISTYPSAGTGVLPGTRVSLLISGNAGFDVNINHDSLGRVSGRSHTVNGHNIYSIQLAYDSRGNISGKTETVSGVQTTWAYTYDADGQLTGAKKNGADAEIFVYDINGNRTSYEQAGEWKVLADYDRQDRLTRMGGAIYQFNADGQLTQRGPDAFLYSATGELFQATVAGQTITYSYDGMGRRVAKTDGAGTWQLSLVMQ